MCKLHKKRRRNAVEEHIANYTLKQSDSKSYHGLDKSCDRRFRFIDHLLNTKDDVLIAKLYLGKELEMNELRSLKKMGSTYINLRLGQLIWPGEYKSPAKFDALSAISQRKREMKHSNDNNYKHNNAFFTEFGLKLAEAQSEDYEKELIHLSELNDYSKLKCQKALSKFNVDIISKTISNPLDILSVKSQTISNPLDKTTLVTQNNNCFSFEENSMNLGFQGFNLIDHQESLEYSWPNIEFPLNCTKEIKKAASKVEKTSEIYKSCLEKKLNLELTLSKFNHISCSLENELCSKLNNSCRANLIKLKGVEEELLNKLIAIKSSSPYHSMSNQICRSSELIDNLKREIEIQLILIQTSKFKFEIFTHCA